MKSTQSPRLLDQRAAGALLHVTSLPGPLGSGDMGAAARAFVDFLKQANVRWWQVLPLCPPGPGACPYISDSAFALSPLLIDADALHRDGLLRAQDMPPPLPSGAKAVFGRGNALRMRLLRRAFERFSAARGGAAAELDAFRQREAHWLRDYVLFRALADDLDTAVWSEWPAALRTREPGALRAARERLSTQCAFQEFVQFAADRQWRSLREYAAARGVSMLGDLPIFVSYESADVWANQELFVLDRRGRPKLVSGCPPDSFAKTGQLWGHPHYEWQRHAESGYAWWIARIRQMRALFDAVRLDHFIGFHRYWAVPASHKTAERGRWLPGPGSDVFSAATAALGQCEIIAEDLGAVTPEVWALRDQFGFPGMNILQWAFGEKSRYDQPHNYPRRRVVYTGTHDNETAAGWFAGVRRDRRKRLGADGLSTYARALRYLNSDGEAIHWDMIRAAYASPANLAVIPVQDWLGLGASARMNVPGKATGNWAWRLTPGALTADIARRLASLADAYER